MSPRAASRLESLGFHQVFDYVAGKQDWFAFGLPIAGRLAGLPKACDAARVDVPTCELNEPIEPVRERVEAAGWNQCVVVDPRRVILGRLRPAALRSGATATAEQVMQSGPSTYRPDVRLEELVERMQKGRTGSVLISRSNGQLLGILFRKDAERLLLEHRGTSG